MLFVSSSLDTSLSHCVSYCSHRYTTEVTTQTSETLTYEAEVQTTEKESISVSLRGCSFMVCEWL